MLKRIFSFCQRYWLIILLTLIGGFLRLYKLETNLQFLGDQGRDALVIKRLIVDYNLPFIGPITSIGSFYLGPLYYYLMAPFLWLFKLNPIGPAYATAFIGIITIPAIYFFTQKLFSSKAAIITSLLYALASIPISGTRGAWNPNPMPLVVLGLVYGLYLSIKKNQPKGVLLASLCLAIALQLHYMIIFLGPFLLWQFVLVIKNKKSRSRLLSAVILFLLIMSPIILFEIKHKFLNLKGLQYYLQTNNYQAFNFFKTLKDIIGRSQEAIGMVLGFGRKTTALRTWVTNLTIFGALWQLWKNRSYEFLLISLWLFLSIFALAFYRGNVYPHYLGFIFPATFILVGVLLSQFKKQLKLIPLALIALFIYHNYLTNPVVTGGPGNLPQLEKTAQFIKQDIIDNQHTAVNVALIDGTRDYKGMNYRYFLEINDIKLLEVDQYDQTNTLYVVSPYDQPDLLSQPMWEISALQPAGISNSWQFPDNSNIYKVQRL